MAKNPGKLFEELTQSRLKECVTYDPMTGIFKRNKGAQGCKPDLIAGTINKTGYRYINIDRKLYKASRLAFLYMEGYFPENDVDHIDRIKINDKWSNLRHITRQCNIRNCDPRKTNTSGVIGVHYDKSCKRWTSQICVNYKTKSLGRFKEKYKAVFARWKAEIKHNYPNCNSKSTSYLYLKDGGYI